MEFKEETNLSEEDEFRISNPFEKQRFSSSGKKIRDSPDPRSSIDPINYKSVSVTYS